jgi:elongation of very long chain fatty acids protein 4
MLTDMFAPSGLGPKEVQQWPLVENGYHVAALTAMYYIIVFMLIQIMKRREKAFELFYFSQVHNIAMALVALYMGVEYIRLYIRDGIKLGYNVVHDDDKQLDHARVQYIFLLSKIPEWNDTFIMILKKNFRQVSILHLWHHGSVFILTFMAMRTIPGGDPNLAACINSWIHVIMYSYYFCAPLAKSKNVNPIVKLVVKFKMLITIGQLVQFLIVFGRDCYIMYNIYVLGKEHCHECGPLYMYWNEVFYMLIMIGMFGNFFVQNYTGGKRQHEKKQ